MGRSEIGSCRRGRHDGDLGGNKTLAGMGDSTHSTGYPSSVRNGQPACPGSHFLAHGTLKVWWETNDNH